MLLGHKAPAPELVVCQQHCSSAGQRERRVNPQTTRCCTNTYLLLLALCRAPPLKEHRQQSCGDEKEMKQITIWSSYWEYTSCCYLGATPRYHNTRQVNEIRRVGKWDTWPREACSTYWCQPPPCYCFKREKGNIIQGKLLLVVNRLCRVCSAWGLYVVIVVCV